MLYKPAEVPKRIWRSIRVLEARGRNEELEEARAACRPYEHRKRGSTLFRWCLSDLLGRGAREGARIA
jgi:hypothetical protein